jgi:RimJ/RimL family protein N-acetyltransferase
MQMDVNLSLEGTLTVLKPFEISDIDQTYISWLNDKQAVKYSNQRFLKHDRDSCLNYFASFKNSTNLFLSVRRLEDQLQIGTMTAYISPHHGTADIGIMIGHKEVWGSGFGGDAWATLSNWLLKQDRIRKVTAGTLACNLGMLNIMERTGMHHEATRKDQEIVSGKCIDILYYAKFR